MKRYWLFAGREFYPLGGMKDFKGDFDSYFDAATHAVKILDEPDISNSLPGWYHIWDSANEIIAL
jgi:hypothetical protein